MGDAVELAEAAAEAPVRGGSVSVRRSRRRAAALASMCVMAIAAALGMLWMVSTSSASAQTGSSSGVGIAPGQTFAKAHEPISGIVTEFTGATDLRNLLNASPEVTQAGKHADAATGFRLINTESGANNTQVLREVIVDAPPGFMGSAVAVPECEFREFFDGVQGNCPPHTRVGIAATQIGTAGGDIAGDKAYVVRLPAPPDAPARFGFKTDLGDVFYLIPALRSDGDYGLRVAASNINYVVIHAVVDLWANPYDPVHDSHRGAVIPAEVRRSAKPFLTNPTYCDSGPLATKLAVRLWLDPNEWIRDTAWSPEPTGCDKLEFGTSRAPVSLDLETDTARAAAPVGLSAKLRLPYNDDVNGLARPALRDTVVDLPEGLIVNPGGGDGLAGCSQAQVRWQREGAADCPSASKLATARVVTPVLAEPLDGAVYLAEPYENPLGVLMAMYIVVKGPGIEAKVVGDVRRDPVTGRLTTVFRDSPQVPFTDLDLRFKSGPRAALVSPSECGSHETVSTLKPWSYPHSGPEAVWTSRFAVSQGPDGGACLSERAFSPRMQAGMADPAARASTSFALRFERDDAQEELGAIPSVRLPEGLLGKVAGVERCGDAQADAGTCPEGSKIGHVQVAAGAGSQPLWVPQPGKDATGVYLTGPYRGAPYGLSIKVPAQAGPFDLGDVVVRSALHVDRRSAAITSGVDQSRLIATDGTVDEVLEGKLPRILEGIVLNQRDIRVNVDRPDFMRNPSSCAPKQVQTTLLSTEGTRADLADRFQADDCADLPFKPKLALRLTGRKQVTTGKHPGIRAQVNQTGIGEAGIQKAVVRLPKSLALDVNNARALCEFADGTKPDLENHCPAGSIIGRARAKTPLLDSELAGNVYFVKNIRKDAKTGNLIRTLPMLVVALRGEVAINLVGESDTTRAGKLVNTFNGVPDAPVSQFNMNVNGGKNGIIAVTRTRAANINLCVKPKSHTAEAEMDGHNGKRHDRDIRMKTPCTKRQTKAAKRAAKRAAKARNR